MSKVYVLQYSTGEYEDYREYLKGYFTTEDSANTMLEKLKEFNKRVEDKNPDSYFISRAYKMILGIDVYADYTGIYWSVPELKCLDKKLCKDGLQ